MRKRPLTPGSYYRLPWNLADNAITWLEPTTKCNLYCEGCYRENDPDGHRPLADVIRELEEVKKLRHTDGISIAGGEPLIYPDIVPLVRYVASKGWKPIINSNGQALTPELVRELAAAGLIGFTMHVDSHQRRPGWKGASEKDLCELRLKLANMIHEHGEGKIACSFNATIYRDTLSEIPMLTRFAHEHIDIIQTMVFILFRSARKKNNFDVFANGRPVDVGNLVYQLDNQEEHQDLSSQEIADAIRLAYPDHEPCAYLNGTENPLSMKWLLTLRVGDKNEILGYLDAKFAEWTQIFHHLFFGTYLAYSRPCWMRWVQKLALLTPFNKSLRKIFCKLLTRPRMWSKPLNIQSIMVIQPCDLLDDGRQDMCDGCPDSIFHDGKMVWSCRVDELEKFGAFIQCAPRGGCCGGGKPAPQPEPTPEPEPVKEPEPAPEPVKEPEPTPEAKPVPAPEPVKEPEPTPVPAPRQETVPAARTMSEPAIKVEIPPAVVTPAQVPAKEPEPEIAKAPEAKPVPEAVKEAEPEAAATPAKEPEPAKAPEPTPAKAAEPAPKPVAKAAPAAPAKGTKPAKGKAADKATKAADKTAKKAGKATKKKSKAR